MIKDKNPFVIGRRYFNRKGQYEVLRIDGNNMLIKYDDGTEQTVSIAIQSRIAENMAINASIKSPYPTNLQSRNEQFFFTLGFLAHKATMLEAIIPVHTEIGFSDDYLQLKGIKPKHGQDGYYVHKPGTDKWGCELRITFQAKKQDCDNLDFGPDVHCVDDPANPGIRWRINNNGFWWKLLAFGFEMGSVQNFVNIIKNIPQAYRKQFDSGYSVVSTN